MRVGVRSELRYTQNVNTNIRACHEQKQRFQIILM